MIVVNLLPHLYQLAEKAVITLAGRPVLVKLGFCRLSETNGASVSYAFHHFTTFLYVHLFARSIYRVK